MLAVSNDQLQEPLRKGDLIKCHKCNKQHKVRLATDKDGNETDALMFIKCNKISYLIGIKGRRVDLPRGEKVAESKPRIKPLMSLVQIQEYLWDAYPYWPDDFELNKVTNAIQQEIDWFKMHCQIDYVVQKITQRNLQNRYLP